RAGRRESVARNLADVHVPVCAVLLRRLYGVPVLVLDRERVLRDAAGIPAAGGAGGLRGGADPPERVLDRAAAFVARDDRSGSRRGRPPRPRPRILVVEGSRRGV